MKCSKLPFSTDEELLKPLLNDPTKFALLLLRLQNDYEVYFQQILKMSQDENTDETLRNRCTEVISAVLPIIVTSRVIVEQFNPQPNVTLTEYKGLTEAYNYLRSLIDQKLDALCQPSQMPSQESDSTSPAV